MAKLKEVPVIETKYMTPAELAERWKTSVGTLAQKRSKGEPPAYVKWQGKVYYKREVIAEMEAQLE